MVEWPKAERYRGQAQKAAVGKRVKSVKFLFAPGSTKDMCFFDGKASEAQMLAFAATIVGKMLEAMCRKGKQLWAVFEGGINVLLHFGLCGKVVFKRAGAQCAWPPYRTKMDITFTDSSSMAFCDTSMQKAARIRVLRGDPTTQPPICGLAPDPVLDGLDVATVTAGFARTSTSVLEILKEQQKSRGAVMCGAGKLFARVILRMAGDIDPETPCNRLSKAQIAKLITTIPDIFSKALERLDDKKPGAEQGATYPSEWKFGQSDNKEEEKKDRVAGAKRKYKN